MGCAVVPLVGSSVGVARSPRAGVPSLPCVVSGGLWACAGVIRMASDSRFGGVCWGRASPGMVRRPLGVGGAGPSVVVCPSCGWVLVPAAMSSFSAPRSLFPPLPWPLGGFLLPCCVAPGAHALWAPARHIEGFCAPLPECPSLPLAVPSPVPFPFPLWWWWAGAGGAAGPGLGPGGLEPLAEGFGGCRGGGGRGPRPGGGPPMPLAA